MPRTEHGENMRKQILSAFGQCLNSQAANSISLRSVAARAGVPLGSIHYYFKSKNDLLTSYFRSIFEDSFVYIDEWCNSLPSSISTPSEFFEHFSSVTKRGFDHDSHEINYAVYYNLLNSSPDLHNLCKEWNTRYANQIASAIERTNLPCKNPLRFAQFLVSLWDGVSLHAELFVEDSNNYELFDAFANMICKDEEQ